jgi:hypothetical protein
VLTRLETEPGSSKYGNVAVMPNADELWCGARLFHRFRDTVPPPGEQPEFSAITNVKGGCLSNQRIRLERCLIPLLHAFRDINNRLLTPDMNCSWSVARGFSIASGILCLHLANSLNFLRLPM